MGKSASAAQTSRARARARMVELERERLERQKRIEDAATAVYLAVGKRDIASAAVADAEHEIAAGLSAILAKGADIERTASLCDLTAADVRRLTRRRSNGHGPVHAP